jgi:hypothetical protein
MTFDLPELLDCFAKRPWMFVYPVSFATVKGYLRGLSAGLHFAGIEYTWEEYLAAAESRGWDSRGSMGIERDFTRYGLSDEEMVKELIAVEVDAYTQALTRANKHD